MKHLILTISLILGATAVSADVGDVYYCTTEKVMGYDPTFLLPDMNDAMDASKAASSVLTAVSEGEFTPIEAQHVSWGLSIATDAL